MTYTPKQLQVLHLIFEFQKEHSFAPTLMEMAEKMDISTVTVFEHLRALERKGAVRRRRHEARSVEIIDHDFLRKQGELKTLPIKGSISCGQPALAAHAQGELPVGELFGSSTESFVLRVSGNSMVDDHILDGDLIILESSDQVQDGEHVVVQLSDGQSVLRKVFHEQGRVRLQPSRPTVPANYLENVKVQGIFRGLVRRCG